MKLAILIVGATRVGKKCYMNRLLTGEFRSILPIVRSHTLNTTLGVVKITYHVSSTVVEGYDGYIFMCDGPKTANIVCATSGVPVVVVNKCDGGVSAQSHTTGLPTFTVSAKWNRGLFEPILYILQSCFGQALRLLNNEATAPQQVNVNRWPVLRRPCWFPF